MNIIIKVIPTLIIGFGLGWYLHKPYIEITGNTFEPGNISCDDRGEAHISYITFDAGPYEGEYVIDLRQNDWPIIPIALVTLHCKQPIWDR